MKEIRNIYGDLLFTYKDEHKTIKDAVEFCVKNKISLQGASLENANLEDASLENASLENANLRYANLRNASLENASLENASLRYANLRNASLEGASLENASLRYANLRNASLENASLENANLRYANLRNASLFCKWSFYIRNEKIVIGCKEKTIEQWDKFFASSEEYQTKRNTQEFKQIQAVYNACKAYLLTLNN